MPTFDDSVPSMTPPATNESVYLSMLKADIGDIKIAIKEYQVDTREEFRRIRDKIDDVTSQMGHDRVNMKELETRQQESAKFAGRIAGSISGFITALVTSLLAVVAKAWLSGNG